MTQTMPNDATDFLPTRRSLLQRLKNADDPRGWQEFFDTYWKLIYGVARKAGLTDAEAQDAVQETIIAVSQHIGDFQYDPAKCSFKTWLMLLTRQRIGRQFARRGIAGVHASAAPENVPKRELDRDDTARTATIERLVDPAGPALEAVWDAEWEKHVLTLATERVKRVVKAKQFQMYDLYVLHQWSAREVARVFGVSVGMVYLAKYRVGLLLKKELRKLTKKG